MVIFLVHIANEGSLKEITIIQEEICWLIRSLPVRLLEDRDPCSFLHTRYFIIFWHIGSIHVY